MPYFIGNTITDRASLVLNTPEKLRKTFNLDVRTQHCVESINREAKTVCVHDLQTNKRIEEPYDKLVLAPGAEPVRPPIPGADLDGVFTLRNLVDMDRIAASVHSADTHATIVGAGFIGLEMAENLRHRGCTVTLVERLEQILPPLDEEMVTSMERELLKNGVDVLLETTATQFTKTESGRIMCEVQAKGESTPSKWETDMVIMSVGVRPDSRLAKEAGLAVNEQSGGIIVNQHMQTDDPDVYAVGDSVEVTDFVLHKPTQIPLAGPANRQGRVAADHVFGRDSEYRGTQGTSILRVFDLEAACTGASEKTLTRLRIPFEKVYVFPKDHAGYYPGANTIALKILFDPQTGRLLGGQALGKAGVDKRIDVLSMAIQGGMTVFDLEEYEPAYAPQFNSAKDPLNMAGFVGAGVIRGDQEQVHYEEMLSRETDDYLVDVRDPPEFEAGHIPGSVNIPLGDLRARLGELPAGSTIVPYCRQGMRGYFANRILRQRGFKAENLSGGYLGVTLWNGDPNDMCDYQLPLDEENSPSQAAMEEAQEKVGDRVRQVTEKLV
eukprot:TRINITY_DN19464_c0_g1_i2.p1 TRINITY_DN19464_c0_g1~~TRINITY_DN19464_c0_g1_i2.p1  ORF type:complete len:552 (-),score=118.37 TRINITY_DN19464_c0_g1_i2:153-1808(-)